VEALRVIGAQIEYLEKEGYPPLRIKGRTLKGGEIELDGSVSSQYISALLMMAPTMTNGLRLHLSGEVVSMSYINLTLQLMSQFGVIVFNEGHTLTVLPQQYDMESDFTVESDWSAASYWYEMVALCKNDEAAVSLNGLWPDSLQGDASIARLFDRLGVKTSFNPLGVTLSKKQRTLDGPLVFDFTSMPDMAQTVAVTCAMQQIPFRFTGLQSLKIKETDRLHALKTELQKLGYLLEIQNDNSLCWNGERVVAATPNVINTPCWNGERVVAATPAVINTPCWNGERGEATTSPVIDTYEDHRMAMAFAPVSLCTENGIRIADPQVVSKSYPSFWDDLKKANFRITEI
jgi:3-phosphoshikimate 1-carboxyvinyltransferase